ncbi:hypothetical protein GCM10007978_47250 [Shewanella hanedai]|uniref:Uncharacterized protein n=1 Tax=Shewanella hanedai TaxID=25 RepID=A0A553JFU6_SHEHA|nr:hypothetical protein [Shewanella hanedai]TRY11303.1 hypothetical protein FN961_24145 [Shewanella hanedai]GGJ04187.1 hypothetical protein GCM10007978_47250 [Shewanella hanedai]
MQIVNSPAQSSLFTTATIVGNASGNWDIAANGVTFIFNGTESPSSKEDTPDSLINISNGPFVGSEAPFVVTGFLDEAEEALLTQQLVEVAEQLEGRLNCWPSTGLVTTVLMTQLSGQLHVKRMSLLPSLSRDLMMSKQEHLPCMVHNWLGERRIALALQTHNLNWRELYLTEPERKNTSVIEHNLMPSIDSQCPFTQLIEIGKHIDCAEEQRQQSISKLEEMSSSHISSWLNHSSQDKLLACESLFFNQTPESTPTHWYLIHNLASQYLDGIRQRLAYCQQTLINEVN